jgi:hypothetical protein
LGVVNAKKLPPTCPSDGGSLQGLVPKEEVSQQLDAAQPDSIACVCNPSRYEHPNQASSSKETTSTNSHHNQDNPTFSMSQQAALAVRLTVHGRTRTRNRKPTSSQRSAGYTPTDLSGTVMAEVLTALPAQLDCRNRALAGLAAQEASLPST